MPEDVTRKLNAAAHRVLRLRDVKERLEADGTLIIGSTPEAFRDFLRADVEKWKRVVQVTGAKPE